MTIKLLPDRSFETDNTQILVYADPTRTLQIVTGQKIRSGFGGHGWYRWDDIIFRGVYIGRYCVMRKAGSGFRMETNTCDTGGSCVLGGDWYWLIKQARARNVQFPIMRGDYVRTGDGTYFGYVSHKAKTKHLSFYIHLGTVDGPLERFAAHTLRLLSTRDELEIERARADRSHREYWG